MGNDERTAKAINRLLGKEYDLDEKQRKLRKEREEIEEQRAKEFRITEVTDHVVQLRKKVLKCVEIKGFLERSGLSIEDAALIVDSHEWPGPFRLEVRHRSVRRSYVFGGPKSRFKIFFRDSSNGQFPLTGFTFDGRFPTSGKDKKAKAEMSKKETARMFGFRRAA